MQTSALRKKLKSLRESISPDLQNLKAQAAADHLQTWLAKHPFTTIASYLTHTGELSTQFINEHLWEQETPVYVPLIGKDKAPSLNFQLIQKNTEMTKNRFGINEPHSNSTLQLDIREIGLVLMPLLGFDHKGDRLGMGGGFYDRALNFALTTPITERPFLLGIAYDRQEVSSLESNEWDVPLDGILTESGVVEFNAT